MAIEKRRMYRYSPNTIGWAHDVEYSISDCYTKEEINEKLVSIYKYRGTVPTVNDLPETSTVGYVYNVFDTGMNYAWEGTHWDALGPDDYITSKDYATSSKAGIFKCSNDYGIAMDAEGFLIGNVRTLEQYTANSGDMIISKGTLENVFVGKDYAPKNYVDDEISELDSKVVKFTDYATSTKGGIIKFSTSHGVNMSADGFLMGATRTAEQYTSNSGNMLINKGTLENVFTSKGFLSNADLETKSEDWEFTLSDGSTVTKKIICL